MRLREVLEGTSLRYFEVSPTWYVMHDQTVYKRWNRGSEIQSKAAFLRFLVHCFLCVNIPCRSRHLKTGRSSSKSARAVRTSGYRERDHRPRSLHKALRNRRAWHTTILAKQTSSDLILTYSKRLSSHIACPRCLTPDFQQMFLGAQAASVSSVECRIIGRSWFRVRYRIISNSGQ